MKSQKTGFHIRDAKRVMTDSTGIIVSSTASRRIYTCSSDSPESDIHGSYRGAYFDEVAVRVIESDDSLSPAVRHQAIDVFNVRIDLCSFLTKLSISGSSKYSSV